jgi:molybdopterin-dependent oxidoreductase alpha subunit
MTRKAPTEDAGEAGLSVGERKRWAAGVPAVIDALRIGRDQMGLRRTALTLRDLNQTGGFDCPGCAWPDPDPEHRHVAEFCENGAKAVAEEATLRRVTPAFFAAHPVSELRERSAYWLGQQGRLTEPMLKPAGADRYEPIAWDAAFALVAKHLRALDSPHEATFYTSGRSSNEAAFLYQLLVRRFGTNNLPDCSNMCHESSGTALAEVIGIGKGSVLLEDVYAADLIVIAGQNPGTNHPRMLSALERAKRNGATIVAINPLPEAGLLRFRNPQTPRGVLGPGTQLADRYVQIKVAGDHAFFKALGALVLEAERAAPGTVLDHEFVDAHTDGFDAYADGLSQLDWDEVRAATGLERGEIEEVAKAYIASDRTIVCWAMGLTQHKAAVQTIQEIANVLFLRGNIGKKGAGVCPVRGHSNVQGDRTVGIFEKMPDWFLDRLRDVFGFEPPRAHGYDTVQAIEAMRDRRTKVFFALGGNFVSATPDTAVTTEAMRGLALNVQVSTKLNHSHLVTDGDALILPCLGRTERDEQAGGPQFVTVEDSMGMVHASRGRLDPASPELRSEVAIVAGLGAQLFDDGGIDWRALAADYDRIRDAIEQVVPGFERFNARVREPGGFALPHPPRDSRTFATATGKARFTASPLQTIRVPEGRLLLQSVRSHDQYNTTIYGLDDRYRGVRQGRRVVFVHPDDIRALGLADGDLVDLVGEWHDGVERRAPGFRLVAYSTARGCAASCFPETNVLVPLDSVADRSNTPASKSVIVRLERAGGRPSSSAS